jgi:DNA-binding MarR family transcriptional regulator
MHVMFFGMKRVHLRVVGITRALLGRIALTPARFDMMRIVALHGEYGILQAKMRDLLGVSAPTVSVMVRSLELLGFVTRRRFERDRRCILVRITESGAQELERAVARLIDSGVADRVAENGLSADPEVGAEDVRVVRRLLSRLRKNYADPAPFEHPWSTQPILVQVVHEIPARWRRYGDRPPCVPYGERAKAPAHPN